MQNLEDVIKESMIEASYTTQNKDGLNEAIDNNDEVSVPFFEEKSLSLNESSIH